LVASPTLTTVVSAMKPMEYVTTEATASDRIAMMTHQTSEANKKAEIIGEDEVAVENDLPYNTSTGSGKLAAALVTGRMQESVVFFAIQ
jgi:hypothetical protein